MKLEHLPTIEASYLESLLEKNVEAYVSAEPFPHIVMDNFFTGSWHTR